MRLPDIVPYVQRGSISGGNLRQINLYAEYNKDQNAPVAVSYYPFPASKYYTQASLINRGNRGMYRTSIGTAYVVIGPNVYFLASNKAMVFVGTITDRQSQVYMADNGLCVVVVDGQSGWVIDINNNSFAQIIDPSFYGADFVLFLDTFFIFNRPATDQFYISLSEVNFALLSGTALGDGTITTAGAGYVDGSYNNVALTGGTGTGATANITVSGNVVTFVSIVDPGVNYSLGDVLSADPANLGGTGAGFT